ncbi:hypothetical protein H6G76_10440 [Nostoc sp. FACHB-152]|uniref:hypothetical protein n=1 Tax=unclassified Nostoc TaxID=2593658 RepID=UPI001689D49B|nr:MULTISPECIES: hypothetical protein [unclassified Nostoc]MBD2447581.1 hypothetical protein [Nostoc sp. FACHB-152]MBD2469353.1 hypothetical protein [Nostoc sp. FACHB-145]
MTKKLILWLIWIGFISYIVLFAPPLHIEETLTLLKNIVTFNWAEINPIILSLFSLVGIWLLIYSGLLFIDGRMQWIPFWPFALASVGSGVLGLLPYLALRESNQEFSGQKDAFLHLLDSRLFGIILSFSTIVIIAYGLLGNWADFVQQFQSDRFINGMSLAFCLFCLLLPTVLGDDMVRRRWNNPTVFWIVSLLPLLGSLAYLCLRPSLQANVGQEFAVANR